MTKDPRPHPPSRRDDRSGDDRYNGDRVGHPGRRDGRRERRGAAARSGASQPLTRTPVAIQPPNPDLPPSDRPATDPPTPQERRSRRLRLTWGQRITKWSSRWQFWLFFAIILPGGGMFFALSTLLRLPSQTDCTTVFWPSASASLRLYCAQVAAEQQTLEKLLEAFALVDVLPANHPLRPEINRAMQAWSLDILKVGEAQFQQGKLTEALSIANQIPIREPDSKGGQELRQTIRDRIQTWQSIWSRAEKIYQEAETEIANENWRRAFLASVRLLTVGNTYWETTKYEELTSRIRIGKDEGSRLAEARRLAQRNSPDDVLAAIKLVQLIKPDSPLYAEAQKLIPKFAEKLLDLAEARLDRQDLDGAKAIVARIPAVANLGRQVEDFNMLAEARSLAWGGTTVDLEAAIAQALKISIDRPYYSRAQQLIVRWQLEIVDVSHLQRARMMANGNTIQDLKSAIAEAELVPPGNPRIGEARQLIQKWTDNIEAIEDQPYLTQADQYAALGTLPGLQAAIATANKVGSDRSLYSEARKKVRQWTQQVERIEDQPILNQARELAQQNDLASAVATAQRIGSGRALSAAAQADIQTWNAQLQGRQNLREARQLALPPADANSLAQAIAIADRVGRNSNLRSEANELIRQWSQELLATAQSQADFDLAGAIAIARKIPSSSGVYNQAQRLIQTWQQRLNAPSPPASP